MKQKKYLGFQATELEAWLIKNDLSARCALLFPGYGASKASLLHEAKVLHNFGFNILLVDFYGVGGSAGEGTSIGYNEAEDVVQSVNFVRNVIHLQTTVLYGKSMGAAAILRAVSKDKVAADYVILESPFSTLLSTTQNRFSKMGLPSFPAAELLLFWGGVMDGTETFLHNPVDYASEVNVPALVMYGSEDPYARPKEAMAVLQALKGRKYAAAFEGAGHVSLIEYDQEKWERSVGSFLRSTQYD